MVQKLTREINDLERQAIQARNTLSEHQKYASVLGGSSTLSMNNIAGLSPRLLPRATLFAQYSDQASNMSAMQHLQQFKMMGRIPYTGNQMMDMQIQMSAFMQFKEASLKMHKQQEIQILNEKEKEIQLEVNQIEQRLAMKRQELESCKQLASQEAKESAPKFGL